MRLFGSSRGDRSRVGITLNYLSSMNHISIFSSNKQLLSK